MNVYGEIARRLRRAARSGTRLHLEVEHARALMDARFYALLTELEGEEIRREVGGSEAALPPIPDPPLLEPVGSKRQRAASEPPITSAAVARAAERRLDILMKTITHRQRSDKGRGRQV